ncbi:MAG: CoA pyrophosphatase [Deltaproteobacteria bacterium]|nr:CoA pyrophosphatase [Deltaproteobacteria bacterium]
MFLTAEAARARLQAHSPQGVGAAGESCPEAAVAAILRFATRPEILLIRRALNPADPWSGHVAFPGGRREPGDADLLATAARETREEVGIDLERQAELLGRLDDVPAIARGRPVALVIVPFVFRAHEGVEPRVEPSRGEVDEALWAPIEPLARGEADTTRAYELQGERVLLPAYRVGGHVVWGLTYRMLRSLFEVLGV